MRLYHGSTTIVSTPEIRAGQNTLDFSVGFYMTTSYEQAEHWTQVKMRRENVEVGYVSIYELDLESAMDSLVIKRFDSADIDWLNYIVNNRNGIQPAEQVDMTIGPVADDNVYSTIRFFETGIIDAQDTIKRLKTEILHDQWVANTPRALQYLTFVEAETILKETK